MIFIMFPCSAMRNELCGPRPPDGTLRVTRERRVRFDCFRCASGDAVVRRRPDVAELKACFLQGQRWWRTQSKSNPSPLPNSLLTGKLTGNFVKFVCLVRF